MAETWEIYLCDPRGERLFLLDSTSGFACNKVRNAVGTCVITLPTEFDELFGLDYILEFWRRPEGGALKFFNAYFVRRWRFYDDDAGNEFTVLWGYDGNYLLKGRVVAYASGTAQAMMTDYLDDMLKAIVVDNHGADAAAGRDLTAVGGGLTVAADLGDAPSATKGFSWQNVLEALQEISQASRAGGTNLYFDMLPKFTANNLIGWEFVTFTGTRGTDHGSASYAPVYFGSQWGNLNGGYYEVDHADEVNYVYGLGRGKGATRISSPAYDETRMGASIWNLREGYANASIAGGGTSTASTQSDAQAMLEKYRPKWKAGGQLLDTEAALFDVHFDFGSTVVLVQRGKQFDVDVTVVGFAVDEDGQEACDMRVEVSSE